MATLPSLHRLALMSYNWFGSLPHHEQSVVLERSTEQQLRAGERLFARGDDADGIYSVVRGVVRLSGMAPDGRETVLDFYGPGVWFGEVSALDGLPRANNADAAEPCVLRHVKSGDLEEILAQRPAFSRALHRLQSQRLRILLTALENYSTQPLEQRLASRLLMLAGQHGTTSDKGLEIGLYLPQETLAQLIGSTRQRVNQIIKEWEGLGILRQRYGRTIVADLDRLERIADAPL